MVTSSTVKRIAAVVLVHALVLGTAVAAAANASAAAAVADAAAPACPRPAKVTRDVAYESIPGVAPRATSLDVYAPAARGTCAPAPVVVWVHGGGWVKGDKRNNMADKVRLWNGQGYVVVSVNYRLSDPRNPSSVHYPSHNQDVASALAWIHAHIAAYGGNPQKLALLGHSAGGGIVAALSTDERYLGAHGLGLDTIDCVGNLDTEGYDVAAKAARNDRGSRLYRFVFGTDPAVQADASPINHVAPGKHIPRSLVVERGEPRRRAIAEQFAAKLRSAGVSVTMLDAASLTHGQVNTNIGAAGDTVMTPAITSFLRTCFA